MSPDEPGSFARPPVRPDGAALRAALDRHRLWLETQGAEGARAILAGACLSGLSLWRADLRAADLAGADLGGADLDHARLCDASLRGTHLAGASLWQADLSGADLSQADLRGAKLDHVVLRSAAMQGTKLGGASFWGAHLEGADLSAAIGLAAAQLEPTSRDAATRLPAFTGADRAAMAARASVVEDEPVSLDRHRGMMAQRATEIRRHLAEVEAQQAGLRQRQAELERFLFAGPAASWEEAAAKARYLLLLFAETEAGRKPRDRKIIAEVLEDFARLSGRLVELMARKDDL